MVNVFQFGEGNFLRAFVDYYFQKAKQNGDFSGGIAICQPRKNNKVISTLKEQEGKYHVLLRGKLDGAVVDLVEDIDCVEAVIDSVSEFDKISSIFASDNLQIVVSNTTEAGICFNSDDKLDNITEASFPAKVTYHLYNRYKAGKDGIVFLPVELIEDNGTALKNCIIDYAKLWELESGFIAYVNNACDFCNTLVDRIVTGFTEYDSDKCAVAAEPYGSFIIEACDRAKSILPFDNISDVKYVESIKNYRERKVKILNGTHTSSVLLAYNMGIDIVRDMMNDELALKFINKLLNEEIIPTIDLPENELAQFSSAVLERFDNPFIDHKLLDISLNSVAKFEARCIPSIIDYYSKYNTACKCMCLSIAGLINFYRLDLANDDESKISFIKNNDINTILSSLWSVDLTKIDTLPALVEEYYNIILSKGVRAAMEYVCNE